MEIGSEFHNNSVIYGKNGYSEICGYPKRYALSGRTALSLIAKELKPILHNIALPDYCCGSMIAPFVHQGLNVSFYSAFDSDNEAIIDMVDAVLVMDYFGFASADTVAFAQRCKNNGKVVIVDATQTAFTYSKAYELADYIVVSYRKWFDSLCAVVYSKNGFSKQEYTTKNHFYSDTWRQAAFLKERYIKLGGVEKQEFLTLFSTANKSLESDYDGFMANESEIEVMLNADSTSLRTKRRENANVLIDEVKKLAESYDVSLIYTQMKDEDCPLFVPILVDEKKRALIRSKLINEGIYCPCHWPVDSRYPYKDTIYHRRELSLICDQRYGAEEMRVQIAALTRAFEE